MINIIILNSTFGGRCYVGEYRIKDDKREKKKMKIESMSELVDYLNNIFRYFEQRGRVYGCVPIKLQKIILLIQAYYHINCKLDIPELDEIMVAKCGFKIPDFPYIGYDTYADNYDNSKIDLSQKDICDLHEFTYSFNCLFSNDRISEDTKNVVISAFSYFAAYDAYKLGGFLDTLKNDPLKKKEGEIITIQEFNASVDSMKDEMNDEIKKFINEKIEKQ